MGNDIKRSEMVINGRLIHFELGHSVEEWESKFPSDDNWDIRLDDFINGAVEADEDLVYWYIGGRLYETDEYLAGK
jgi:hypothetical protein